MGKWLFGLAIVMVVGGFGLIFEWTGASRQVSIPAGLAIHVAGWLLLAIVMGCRKRRRVLVETASAGSEEGAEGRYVAGSHALATSSRTGVVPRSL